MRILTGIAAGAFLIALTAAAPPAEPQTTPAPSAASAGIDPTAVAAVQASARYLQSLKSFEMRAQATMDEVVEDDLKVELTSQTRYDYAAPDRLFVDWRTDRISRRLYLDGKTVTLLAPRMGYFASVPQTGNVEATLKKAAEEYGIVMPLPDIFLWALSTTPPYPDLQRAMKVGFARIAGVDTDQYVFRQADVDWQVWIQRGDQPLPRKVVISDRTNPARPKFSALLAWNLNPTLPADQFTFTPPAGTAPIEIGRITEAGQ